MLARTASFVVASTLVLLGGGCGSGATKTTTVTAPARTVTVPAQTATPTTPATTATQPSSGAGYRRPAAGEARLTVAGQVARGATHRTSGQSDSSVSTYFELQPDDGGAPLRIGVAGDLALPPAVRGALADPKCSGKLRGTFTVLPAPAHETAFEWQLLTASVPSTRCGGP